MTAVELLALLNKQGIALSVDGSDLRISAPKGSLTDELKTQLSRHKSELLEILATDNHSSAQDLSSLQPVSREASLPLSYAQERLWFLSQLDEDSPVYNIPWSMRLRGPINKDALQAAASELLKRHESLRTGFATENQQAVQLIEANLALSIAQESLRGATDEALAARLTELAQLPFRLDQPPLLRIHLLEVADDDHVLVLVIHHIIADGWSMGTLLGDLAAFYAAELKGESAKLPELPVQYADYAVWQRERLSGQELERQLNYWRDRLAGAPALLELPTDFTRPAAPEYRGAWANRLMPLDLLNQLNELGKQHGCTLYMVLLAAFDVLLGKYSGQNDIVVGAPIAGRLHTELESLIGFFVNTAVLRADLSGNPPFTDLLEQVQQTALDAFSHQDLPFEKLVEELQPNRDRSYSPLFQVAFTLQNREQELLPFAGLEVSPLIAETGTSKFDLTALVEEKATGLQVWFEYNTDLFRASTMERMLEHFETLLGSVVRNPEQRVAALPLLTDTQQGRLLADWQNAERDYSSDLCIHQLFEIQAARNPDAIAVSCDAKRLTYSQLNSRANQVAHALIQRGVKPDTLIGLSMERSIDLVAGILGILKAGAGYLPLDPHYPSDRLAFMIEDSQTPLVLTQRAIQDELPAHDAEIVCIEDIAADGMDENPATNVTAANLAYVIYTSGSTGKPKGALIQHDNLTRLLTATDDWFGFGPTDVWTLFHSYAFDFTVWELWGSLAYGGHLVVVPYFVSRSPDEFHKLLVDEQVTVLNQTPSAFAELMRVDSTAPTDALNLRYVIFGGEALDPQTLRPWFSRHGVFKPQLINMYGITETTVHVTYRPLTLADCDNKASTIGIPIPDLQVYVLDTEGQPLPVGVPGEMFVGGAGLARGYLNRPELTNERFIPNPFSDDPNDRLYRTGDRARYCEYGDLEYLGRVDDQVKIRGFRIEPGEIEAALNSSAAVDQSVVVVRADPRGDRQLIAYIVGAADTTADTHALREHLKQNLPDYMVPAAFVEMAALPLTANGKVDRKALPEPAWDSSASTDYVAPRTPVEAALVEMWQDLLAAEKIGVHHDFFELGGHSLLATRLVARIRDTLNCDLPLKALFDSPTIAALAETIDTSEAHTRQPISQRPDQETAPLSAAQQRLWILDQMEPGNPVYNIPLAIRLTGELDSEALQTSVEQLVARHESLRTRFKIVNGEPRQLIAPELIVRVQERDMSGASNARLNTELTQLTQHHFALDKGPLLSVNLLRLDSNDHVLHLVMHHIVGDAWSTDVLVRELAALYNASPDAKAALLPDLPIQFADYAVWQQERLQGPDMQEALQYWKEKLTGAPTILDLPTDRPRPAVQTFNGAWHELRLPAELTSQLKDLAQTNNATLYMVLLAAFNILLSRYSGQKDVVVGSPIAGRQQTELENLIGFFINTLVMRTDLDNNPSFVELVAQLKTTALEAYAHQELPFEQLVEELQPARDTSYSPLFQVMFILQNAPVTLTPFAGLDSAPVLFEFGTAKLDLTLSMEESAGELVAYFEYNTDLFDADSIGRMARHFHQLLDAVTATPEKTVSEIEVLGQQERRQLLHDWNTTAVEYPRDLALHALVEQRAAASQGTVAVISGDQQLSYGELNNQANRLAHKLLELGAGKDKPVGLCLDRSTDMVVGLLGILKSGSCYVPLDPDFPADRLRYMLEDSAAPILVTQSDKLRVAEGLSIATVCLDQADLSELPTANPERNVAATDLAYIIYTSGSTGKPKGVAIEHRAAINFLLSMLREPGIDSSDTLLAVTTLSFDISILEIFCPLLASGTVVVATKSIAIDGFALARTLQEYDVTVMQATPATWRMLLQTGWQGHPELKILCGGEALDPGLAAQLRGCGTELWNMYGPTETTIWSTCERIAPDSKAITVGRPIANTHCYILDEQHQPVPIGVGGELWIGGDGVARGYLNRPELTAEKFVANPFVSDARMYSTGDLARFKADGRIEVLGRTDFQVKLRGFRIELGEIEAALAEHSEIEQCITVLREDTPGDQRLVAYLTPASATLTENIPDDESLRNQLRSELPEYMIPAAFMRLDALPLTPNGKIDRNQLPTPEWTAAQQFVAPRDELEESLATLWCEVLGIDKVGVYDDFFALGGHSLLATRLISRVLDTLDIELPLMSLFNHRTIAGLAEELADREHADSAGRIELLPRDGKLPLSYAQQRLWFLDELSPGDPMYNVPWVMRLQGTVNTAALQRALNNVIARHESLRTVFPSVAGEAIQQIMAQLIVTIGTEDMRDSDDAAVQQRITQLTQQRMNLSEGPLVYITLLRVSDDEWLMTQIIHHIIFDAGSHNVFIAELARFYNAELAGDELQLPALEIEFADYAGWQRDWYGSADFERQLSYWKNQLGDASGTLDLPTDHPRPPVQTSNGANIARMLPDDLYRGVQGMVKQEGASLFMVTLAAFNLLMSRYSGQDDLLVGTPLSGRKRSELEKIVGFFLHTLVIRADLSGEPSFREFLARTRQTVLEAFSNQELPFETLVEALEPERDTSRHPLFQVHFVVQHVDVDWQMFDGITAAPVEFEFGTAKFDIMFFVFEANDSLSVRIEYNTDLFEAATIERMIDHFETLLTSIFANPEQAVGELPMLPAQERQTLLVEWNQTDFDYPAGGTMHGYFEAQVAKQPDAIALLAGDTELSYRELNRRANKLAAELQQFGVGPEILVAICSERCAELIIGILAIQKAGGAYVPVDPEYPPQRVAHMLTDSAAPVLLTQTGLLARLPEHSAQVVCLDTFDWITASQHDINPSSGVAADNLGYTIYTSGSTGLPKGVEIEHGNAVALIEWAGQAFKADEFEGVLASTSICFDLSVFEIFCPLGLGGRMVLVKDALALPELDESAGVTLINTVPSAMAELVRIKGVPASVNTVNLAGEPLSTALVNSIYQLGTVDRVNDLYGPSEDTTYSTWTLRQANALPSIGRPVYNTQAYLLDQFGEPVPIGVPGELYLGGAGVTRGYRNRPDLTASRYVHNPFSDAPNARMYRTGDQVRYRSDGNLEFIGRLDHQVKLRGFRIELGEIETALASHSAVENTVVMAREDREGDKRLVAYIVASTDGLEGDELEQWESEQVNQWQDLWQDAYSHSSEVEDLAYDFKGWNSSYSGDAIPEAEMRAWLSDTSERIGQLHPRNVLEIGSGSGLVVGQIAPNCDNYTATDFSAASIATLENLHASHPEIGELQLVQGTADQVATLGEGDFDTIVVNSVAQYFPDIDYLLAFVQQAVTRIPAGGHIFLGDLRSLPLLELYHTSVQLFQAEDSTPLPELSERIRQRTEQEEELLIDPTFFVALQKSLPEISGVRLQVKRTRYRNELTRFRYDVVLAVNSDVVLPPDPQHLDWSTAELELGGLEAKLAALDDDGLLITGIPDARLTAERHAYAQLEFAEDGDVAGLRAALAGDADGIEPEDLFELADKLSLDIQLSSALPGELTALFRRGKPGFDGNLMHAPRPVPWRDYGNDPLQGRLQRSLVPILKERLTEAVPEYMMPSAFVILDAFPLTPNGKVNRKALPAPERKRSEQEVYVAPRSETEEQLVAIWADVLGVKQIGVHDDFFALGGHSLLATQLISRIRDGLNTELPLLALFNHPTVAGLAIEIAGDSAALASAVIRPCGRDSDIPLSFAQQRLWFLDQLEGISSAYNVPLALALNGTLNIDALQAAVDMLVVRHESLRTSFATAQGSAVQVINPEQAVPVTVVDLQDATATELQAKLEELAQTPFDLADDALVRVHVLRAAPQRQTLLLLMHHIVSDGWSLGILARELAALYAANCGDGDADANLVELPIQYADFAVWQRGWLAGEELRRQIAYWAERLDGAPALLQLPTDRPRQSVQTFKGAHINRTFSKELGTQLRDLAAAEDATLFMTLLAAFHTLLNRYTGADDIVVGTPIAGRTRTEIEGLIGFFVNTLAMRADLGGDPDFIEVVRRVKQTALGAYGHQELPFEKLVEELQPDRDTSHPPIFQVLFVLQENLSDDIAFHDLDVTPLDFELGSSKFDLSMFMVEFPEGLTASIEYNTDLFDAATIESMLAHFETLLGAIVTNPARPISQLPLLDADERRHVLEDFNATGLETSALSVHALVERQAAATPEQEALSFGNRSLSYAELNRRANCLAAQLRRHEVMPGALVGICAGRGIDTAVSVLAVLKAGAAYVPIDPNYPADRVSYMLNDCRAPVLLTESGLLEQLPEHGATTICLDEFDWDATSSGNPGELGGELVYAIYTSGSTGKPKGVELTHAGLANLIQWQATQPGLDTPARTLQFASLSFDVSFQELFTTWAQGGTVVLVDEELRRDLPALARFIARENIERVYLPFAALQPLAECVSEDTSLSFAVRDVVVAGEQLQITPQVRQMFRVLSNARLHNQYGPSEAHVVTAYTLGPDVDAWMPLPPIGTPVANTRAYVLDTRHEPVPVGVPGELYLGGVQVGRGYIHRKELTAEKFLPDPFAKGATDNKLARMYKTGDRVRFLSDGNIEYLGRTDDQVKWRGFRIEPGEIEAALNEYPGVVQAAVMLREDNPGDKRLVAYLAAGDAGLDTAAVRDWLREQIPDYMLPSAFVMLEAMPLTPSGKVARRKLPVPDYADVAQLYVAPRTPVEEALVQIWSDILGTPQVGIHDDFFELGGHSLLATQLLARVRDALDVELPLIALFNHPSVAALASDVAAASGAPQLEPIQRCDRSQPLPLSFAQQRLWFLDQLEPGNPVYNVPWAMRLDGPLDLQALQAAVDELVARHETLRTLFSVTMGKPQQCVLDKVSVPVESVDATGDDDAAIEVRLRNLSRAPFGLGQTPLMRVHVLHVGNQSNVLLLVLHHIVSDGWSLSILYQELVRLYGAHCKNERISLPQLPVQYADYSVWQRDWFRSSEQERQLDYWRQRLLSAPAILDMPTDRPRGATQTYNGAFIERVLPDAIHTGLLGLARSENSTLFMVCLAAFNVLLARYTGQKDICVGTPVAGRRHTELEGLIGFFINTLVMRNDLEDNPDFTELVARVKHTALEAYAHQELPFEKLVDELQPIRDMSHAPLFQVAFILQNTPWDQSTTLHDLEISPIELDYGVAKFDLSLVMAERREGLLVHFEYNTDLYDADTIERMVGHFETLLLAIVTDPHTSLATMPMLTASEREQILFEWNATDVPFPDNTCIHTLIEQRTELQPGAPAILFRNESISFADLNARANQLAHYLISQGAGPGVIVGLCLERSINLVIGLLGIFKAGAAYVPLDPNYPSERLEWMLEDSRAPLLITQTALLDQLPHNEAQTICVDLDWQEIANHPNTNPEGGARPDDLAYVIYTSGSTGKPKGVMIPHRGACNLADAQARTFGLGPQDRMLQFASISFDASIFELIMGLQVGAAMVMGPPDDLLPGKPLLQTLEMKGVTAVTLPPTALSQLPAAVLPELRTVTVAGEACPPELVEQWGVNRRFFNLYGPTESTVWASYAECTPGEPITIGRPVTNARLYVLDENLQPVPVGVAGELCIGGAGLARGYLNRDALTAEKFRPDPFRDESDARIYRTGDRVHFLPDGNIDFLGRIDYQVKVRGFRIELGEIETTLSAHKDVREAVVIARGAGLQTKRLVAYIIPTGNAELSLGELRAHLKASLPEFMIPAAFVELDSFPLTPNGKVDRNALPEPDQQRMALEVEYIAPRDNSERVLAAIWQELLNVEQVGIHDNFFELGGDSILSIQIIARASQANIHLTPKQLFQYQTIAELAAAAGTGEGRSAEQGLVVGELPLTPIQHWFFERQGEDPHHFNQSQLLESETSLNPQILEQAFRKVIEHHDALRTRFRCEDGTWQIRQLEPDDTPILRRISIEALSDAQQDQQMRGLSNALQNSMEPATESVVKALLFQRGPDIPDRLLIVIHHIAVDWVSWNILLQDLQTAYHALLSETALALPAKTTSFKAWAERLTEHAHSEAVQDEAAYWATQAWDAPDALPQDHDRGPNLESTTKDVTVTLSKQETHSLLRDVPRAWRTQINDLLLTGVAGAVGNWTGNKAVAINLEGHGREDLFDDFDLSRTVGWYTTLFPVLLKVPGADRGAALNATKQQLRNIPFKGINFGVLRYLAGAGSLAQLPEPEIGFNYLGQLDQVAGTDSLLSPSAAWRGHELNPAMERPHLLDIAAAVSGGQLQLSVLYSDNRFAADTIEAFANDIATELRALIKFCLSSTDRPFTPADFPLAKLNQQELDTVLATADSIDDLYTVTSLQHGMLFHSLYTAEQDVYFARFRWRLTGSLNAAAFSQAWQHVVERHTSLRTSFQWEGLPQPVQIVHSDVNISLHAESWEDQTTDQQERSLIDYLDKDETRRFDFTAAPLMRLSLIRLGPDDHQFVWSFHHAIIDGWSVPLVLKEVFAIYNSIVGDTPAELAEPRPFSAYLDWLARQDMGAAESYWRGKLAGFAAPTPLPASNDIVRTAGTEPDFQELRFQIGEATVAQLRELSARSRLTLNTLVQGVWALLLSRYSGADDIVYGATTSGRPATMPGVESMIGLFLNSLPVRTHIDADQQLLGWLEQLQDAQLDSRQYEFASLVEVQGWSDVPRGSPMFESLLAFENYPEMETMWTDTESVTIREVDGFDRTNFPLTINVAVFDILHLRLVYDAHRFRQADMQRLGGHFEALLQDIAANPNRRLRELSLLSDTEQQTLAAWNSTARDYPADATLVSLFEAQANLSPTAIAASFEGGTLSYGELNQRANQLAHYLRTKNVTADTPVGVCIERSIELVVALLGILKAGGAYVPLDPEYPQQRLAHMLEDADIATLITHPAVADSLPEHSADVILINTDWANIELQPDHDPAPVAGPNNLAYVIFTSGSTGRPKGVMNEHHGICNRLLWMQEQYQLTPDDRVMQKTPFSFDVSVWEFFWPLITGAELVIAKPGGHRDTTYLARLIEDRAITTMHFVPSMLQVFLQDPNAAQCDSLRRVICSGEALPHDLQQRFFTTISSELHNLYGPTEAAVDVSYWACQPDSSATTVPIGRPVANTQLHVVDKSGREVPVGVPGELWIGGTQVARGYVNRPELTSDAFIDNPFSSESGARVYRTGDLVRWRDDGNLEFLGRIDHQVKLRGFRIELGEIEASLDALVGIEQSVVMLREDAPGLKQLVAYVVTANQADFDAEAVRNLLAAELPDYMLPAAFVALEAVPLTPNGKVDRQALPAPEAIVATTEYVAPRNTTETQLAELWTELLDVERVGIHDDFFALGGHSLIAMQMVSRILASMQVELPLDSLFSAPTIGDLANIVNESRDTSAPVSQIKPISRASRRTRKKRE